MVAKAGLIHRLLRVFCLSQLGMRHAGTAMKRIHGREWPGFFVIWPGVLERGYAEMGKATVGQRCFGQILFVFAIGIENYLAGSGSVVGGRVFETGWGLIYGEAVEDLRRCL